MEIQRRRVAEINETVRRTRKSHGPKRVIWASGGDGGHIAFLEGDYARAAVDLAIELYRWSEAEKLPMRVVLSCGDAEIIRGADGREQLVGHGINFAARLMLFGGRGRIVVDSDFRKVIESAKLDDIIFHDPQCVEPKDFSSGQIWLLSKPGVISSTWDVSSRLGDRTMLQIALQQEDALEVLYRARRLLQINPDDREAKDALGDVQQKTMRFPSEAGMMRELILDRDCGEICVSAGQLVERQAGDIICEYGDEGNIMFLILHGSVRYFLPGQNFQEEKKMGRGWLIGDLAFALRRKRTATLVCREETALLAVDYSNVLRVALTSPVYQKIQDRMSAAILSKVVEHVCNSANYLIGLNKDGPLAKLNIRPDNLRQYSVLIEHKRGEMLRRRTEGFGLPGVYVLVSGIVREAGKPERLNGADYPILFLDLPGCSPPINEYTLHDDIKVLVIRAQFVERLDADQSELVVDALRHAYERINGRHGDVAEKPALEARPADVAGPARYDKRRRAVELLDKINNIVQLESLMFVLAMPHEDRPTGNIAEQRLQVLNWAVKREGVGIDRFLEELDHLIEQSRKTAR
jgi:hypothetical protein